MAKAKKCKECGGPARGRGYSHTARCSMKIAPPRSRIGFARKRSIASNSGDMRKLKAMNIYALLEFRKMVDEAIASKKPEIQKQIRELNKALKTFG